MQIRAKKSLGQHFLNSPSILARIIETAHVGKGESVLEIGPGTGILTDALLKAGAKVTAVEKDSRVIAMLGIQFEKQIADGQLKIISGDILEIDPAVLGFSNGSYALVANIPYYITGAILEKFLEDEP